LSDLAIICTAAWFTGFLFEQALPEAAGSGIPQLKLAFWKDFGHTPPHIAADVLNAKSGSLKFLAYDLEQILR
jgi:hypothetical protein